MNMGSKIAKIYVVSHTHWDREWYEDFQNYRTRLVYFLDELLDYLENTPSYKHFMLDGQTIPVDDYLELRPERRQQLERFVREGRIAVGPWYVMPDEFLVSGEALIRNLSIGFRKSRQLGSEPMKSGYVTDLFGHNSQMPQIFRGFGIGNAVLFRGFYGDGDDAEIWWEGADGSRVLGLKLDEDRSYSDFYFFLRWPFADRNYEYEEKELLERAQHMLAYKQERSTTGIAIGLDGCDHVEIEPRLPWMLELLNKGGLGAEWEHTSLEQYVGELEQQLERQGDRLKVFRGEQRSPGYVGVNNSVLANVLSSRIHLKQLNQANEYLLQGWAEPWSVFAAAEGKPYPQAFLEEAWKQLIQNHPHDSICGCSISRVHEDMLYRFAQCQSIGERMSGESLHYIAGHIDAAALGGDHALVVFHAGQRPWQGIVEAELEWPAGASPLVANRLMQGSDFRLFDDAGREVPYQVLGVRAGSVRKWRPYRDLPRAEGVDRITLAFEASLPAFGYAAFTVKAERSEPPQAGGYAFARHAEPVRYLGTQQAAPGRWENGRLAVEIASNGTLSVEDLQTGYRAQQLLLLEDEADVGDGWNHIAPPANEVVHSACAQASFAVVHDGPLETRLRISVLLEVPEAAAPGKLARAAKRVQLPIETFITLRKGDPLLRCRTVVANHARDHRLKVLFPAAFPCSEYYTSTPFDLVRREAASPDYSRYKEKDSGIVPHNGLVALADANEEYGMAVFSKGLYEAQVRQSASSHSPGSTIALTLYRSTGDEVLSDGGDGGQLLRTLEFEYALRLFCPTSEPLPQLLQEQQHYAIDAVRTVNRKPGPPAYETPYRRELSLPACRSYLELAGAAPSLAISAVKQAEDHPGALIVRLWNCADAPASGELRFHFPVASYQRVNLDEQPLEEGREAERGVVPVSAKGKEIVTWKIIPARGDGAR